MSELEGHKVELLSEIDFAWRIKEEIAPNQKWIALTGTNGKTTTVQMVNSIFEAAGIAGVACGNVGDTVVEAVTSSSPFDYLALELSSFQIEWSHEASFEAAAILNIAEDHIDWHGSFNNYANSKFKLLKQSRCAILNRDDVEVAKEWIDGDVSLVVITRGANGLVGITKSGVYTVPGVKVDVVDTIGAGDTVGAVIAEAVNKFGLEELDDAALLVSMEKAARAAAITCTRKGANPPTSRELNLD